VVADRNNSPNKLDTSQTYHLDFEPTSRCSFSLVLRA